MAWQIGVPRWLERRRALAAVRFEARLAEERAKVRLAPYKVKADIEWDLRWLSPIDRGWRAELLICLWATPVVALFIPPTRPWAISFFEALKDFDPNGPAFYLAGWSIAFAATFGIKGVANMLPGRLSRVVEAMSKAPSDVPDEAVTAAEQAASSPPDGPQQEGGTPEGNNPN